jgi:hypothetical protein
VLTAQGDAGRAIARYNDIVDEAGERGDTADKEGSDGAPVASESGRVAVDAVEVVHVGYGHVTASDDVIAVARDKNGLVDMDVVGWGCVIVGGQTRS